MSIFGATETGALLTSKRDFANDKVWSYVRLEGKAVGHVEMEPRGENTFEVVAKASWPALIGTSRPHLLPSAQNRNCGERLKLGQLIIDRMARMRSKICLSVIRSMRIGTSTLDGWTIRERTKIHRGQFHRLTVSPKIDADPGREDQSSAY